MNQQDSLHLFCLYLCLCNKYRQVFHSVFLIVKTTKYTTSITFCHFCHRGMKQTTYLCVEKQFFYYIEYINL